MEIIINLKGDVVLERIEGIGAHGQTIEYRLKGNADATFPTGDIRSTNISIPMKAECFEELASVPTEKRENMRLEGKYKIIID